MTAATIVTGAELLEALANGDLTPPVKMPFFDGAAPSPFYEGWSHLLSAYPKVGKTELITRIAAEWCRKGHSVLYITEEPMGVWAKRLRSMRWPAANLHLYFAMDQTGKAIIANIRQHKAPVVILDTVRLLGIEDENDTALVTRLMRPLITACRKGEKTLVAVCHSRKSGGEYGMAVAGSHAFAGIVDVVLELNRVKKEKNMRVMSGIGRIDEVEDVLYVKDGRDFKVVHSQSTTERVIDKIRGLILPGEGWTVKEIAEEIPGHSIDKTIRPALRELVQTGELGMRKRAGKGTPDEYTWREEES